MEISFLEIVFKAEFRNNDMWHFVQVHSTELVYNQAIMGHWA